MGISHELSDELRTKCELLGIWISSFQNKWWIARVPDLQYYRHTSTRSIKYYDTMHEALQDYIAGNGRW